MRIRGRSASNALAKVASKVLGVEPKGEAEEARFSNLVHWGYGTGGGAVRRLIDLAGLKGPGAAAAHFSTLWGAEQVMLPTLNVAPPFWQWRAKEVAIDSLHHLVCASVTSIAYTALDRGPAKLASVQRVSSYSSWHTRSALSSPRLSRCCYLDKVIWVSV